MRITAPESAKDRFEVYRFFNGLAVEGKEGLDAGRTRIPLVKTFLVEHVSARSGRTPKSPAEIFRDIGVNLRQIDDTFLSVHVPDETVQGAPKPLVTTGFIEQYDERFFAYYTVEHSEDARRLVRRWITHSPDLDSAWFSSQLLQSLWDRDVSHRGDNRIVKFTFKYDSIFEMPEDAVQATDEEEDAEVPETDREDDKIEIERRWKARSAVSDRIGRIRAALETLQRNYSPLHALFSLRFPSRRGFGSHDLFQHGQVTNRSDSFEDHRNTVRYLYRAYKSVLEATEDAAWNKVQPPSHDKPVGLNVKGVPLIVRFKEELSPSTFQRWMSLAFQKKNQFRLWGEPIQLGPTKVHVYGADRHLWQPINLELTAKGVVAILPQGTCGNTFHRLVTNIQRYVCPNIEAWLGSKSFQSLADSMPSEQETSDEKSVIR
jgi:hypothetical protein